MFPSLSTPLQNTLLALACSALVVGCVDEGRDDGEPSQAQVVGLEEGGLLPTLTPGRSFEEELLAEDMEALLPGDWVWDQRASSLPEAMSAVEELSIVFLGHDAVTGDVALLIEEDHHSGQLLPARVSLDESEATLRFPETETALGIEHIEDDLLILRSESDGTRLVYRRHR